jgi:hypothetical protein
MAKKEANPTGVYRPLTWRAKRLTAQLRRATHRTVQNAIIAELIHEMTKGSRRVRKQASLWGAKVKQHARQAGGRAGTAARKRVADVGRRVRYGPPMHCVACNKSFRSKLLFNAHAEAHKRAQAGRQRPGNARRVQGPEINTGIIPGGASRARAHAASVLGVAGPQKAKAARTAAAKAAGPAGRPLGAKDLKAMAKQVTETRNAPPARPAETAGPARKPAATRTPASARTPAAAARAAADPQMPRPGRPAATTTRPPVRAPRTPSAARTAPARPGPGA